MCKAYVLQDLHYLSLKAGGGGSALEGAETRGPSDVLEVEAEALGPGPEFPESRIMAKLAQSAKFKFCKFRRARSRLYQNEILQVNMRLKALTEIYTMHSFAQLLESIIEIWGKKNLAKTTPKKEKTRKREAIKQLAAYHSQLQRKGAAKKNRENKES